MHGDFSILNFDPRERERGVDTPQDGVLRNMTGVLQQQGRVITDADLNESEILDLGWRGDAARDIIGAGICAVSATEPDGFRIESASIVDDEVHVGVMPGRAWVDGILTRLTSTIADPEAAIERVTSEL